MNILQSAIALFSMPAHNYAHECGHKAALELLFNNPCAKITLYHYGFSVAKLRYSVNTLSPIGEFFGKDKAKCIVAAAGPTVNALLCIATWSSDLPILTLFTTLHALNLATYALSSFYFRNVKGHDFLEIKDKGGILPFGMAVGLSTIVGFGYCALTINAYVTGKIVRSDLYHATAALVISYAIPKLIPKEPK